MSRRKLYKSIKEQIMQNNPEEFAAYKKKRINTTMREQKAQHSVEWKQDRRLKNKPAFDWVIKENDLVKIKITGKNPEWQFNGTPVEEIENIVFIVIAKSKRNPINWGLCESVDNMWGHVNTGEKTEFANIIGGVHNVWIKVSMLRKI
tara:strand:- start:1311 stop:1754 length:444 start_codon:yes stop_codon:yes gene_type:complete